VKTYSDKYKLMCDPLSLLIRNLNQETRSCLG